MFTSVLPTDPWTRDAALVITGWLLATVVGIVLLLTVVTWLLS